MMEKVKNKKKIVTELLSLDFVQPNHNNVLKCGIAFTDCTCIPIAVNKFKDVNQGHTVFLYST